MKNKNKKAEKLQKKTKKLSIDAAAIAELKIEEKIKKKSKNFWSEFKKFITKGNIVDLAVAMIIGVAFNDIVKGLVNFIITPLTGYFIGVGVDLTDLKWVLREAVEATETTKAVTELSVKYGSFLQTVINFFVIALSIFIALKIYMNAMRLLNRREEAKKKAAEAKKKAEDAKKAEEEKARLAAEKAAVEQFFKNEAEQAEILRDIRRLLEKQNGK